MKGKGKVPRSSVLEDNVRFVSIQFSRILWRDQTDFSPLEALKSFEASHKRCFDTIAVCAPTWFAPGVLLPSE